MSVNEITETRQYLTFKLGNEVFGIDVAKVREVLDFTTITEIPRTPEFMSGVINLRGSVVPVVDLRLCFEMSKTERTRNTCIVVVEVLLEGESTVIGALADSVEEVIDLEPDQIQPAPTHRHPDPHRLHQGHGQARLAIHHDPGHRPGLFRRKSCSAVRNAEAEPAC
jgi:purine-binding chemotaxis protein CheW